jgi:hypothetical protein
MVAIADILGKRQVDEPVDEFFDMDVKSCPAEIYT